jgi:hypothetical protein
MARRSGSSSTYMIRDKAGIGIPFNTIAAHAQ